MGMCVGTPSNSSGVAKGTMKPQLKPSSSKGFMADIKHSSQKKVEGQVQDILKNLK